MKKAVESTDDSDWAAINRYARMRFNHKSDVHECDSDFCDRVPPYIRLSYCICKLIVSTEMNVTQIQQTSFKWQLCIYPSRYMCIINYNSTRVEVKYNRTRVTCDSSFIPL